MPGKRAFASDLKEARRAAGLTQVKLAQRLGVDPGAISGWERAIRMPDDQNRHAVADFMGISVADFLVRYEATSGHQNGPASPQEEETGARVRKQAEEAQRLSEDELRVLRRLLERLEETG